MRGKLKENANHYTTKVLRMAYIESCTDDDAVNHLKSHLQNELSNKFQTAREMLNCLKTIYLNFNCV